MCSHPNYVSYPNEKNGQKVEVRICVDCRRYVGEVLVDELKGMDSYRMMRSIKITPFNKGIVKENDFDLVERYREIMTSTRLSIFQESDVKACVERMTSYATPGVG